MACLPVKNKLRVLRNIKGSKKRTENEKQGGTTRDTQFKNDFSHGLSSIRASFDTRKIDRTNSQTANPFFLKRSKKVVKIDQKFEEERKRRE